jgi:signal transduction histidine kinase
MRKVEEGKMEYKMEGKKLVPLLESVVEELGSLAKDKSLELSFTSLVRDDVAFIDEQYFRQVIQNLVENAIKYTDAGFVKVELTEDQTNLVISVTDSGRGVPSDILPRLFGEFSRGSDATRSIGGTGLGLFIAKKIVEAHKGEVGVRSPGEGQGSTFFIKIPKMV